MTKPEILRQVEAVIADGPYKDNWRSLCAYQPPSWYSDAKFGIFIHWGPYAVPAFGNEWYPRNMYLPGTPEYEHHKKAWGPQQMFGYKDFIPLFKGERFNADEWIQLFRDAGARYVVPVAEHHDGFQMYASELSKWNAARMGPCRDIIGELQEAAAREGLVFGVSNHRAEHCWFFNGGRDYPCDVTDPAYEDFYGQQQDGGVDVSHDIHSVSPSKEHCEDWLARVCELVDQYRPKLIWFDWWLHNVGFKPYLKKFAAYYYNRAHQWGEQVAINYKFNAFAYGVAVFDVERGQLAGIRPVLWQTDTAVAKNSWGYTENNDFKDPVDLVCALVDVVSKNGCLLLNVGPRADGSIAEEDRRVLLAIGEWLGKNADGIYGTTFWERYGEGPTQVAQGAFTDTDQAPYTPQDIRFTYRGGVLYAFVMRYPPDGIIQIASLASGTAEIGTGDADIVDVKMLGYNAAVDFTRTPAGLQIRVDGKIDTPYPVGFAIQLD